MISLCAFFMTRVWRLDAFTLWVILMSVTM
jgi:hypothetical protein